MSFVCCFHDQRSVTMRQTTKRTRKNYLLCHFTEVRSDSTSETFLPRYAMRKKQSTTAVVAASPPQKIVQWLPSD